ncbi:MAG: hypothetical protein K2M07_05140 [Muribaculaceae bacterium]|nr:hypothetical protein [Muribaculaceae bacterium]
MKKMPYILLCLIMALYMGSCKSDRISLCAYCNQVEVYFELMPFNQRKYLILFYEDSIFFEHVSGLPFDFGKFRIHNDTLTCMPYYYLEYNERAIPFTATLDKDEYSTAHIWNYRIERGGESLYYIELFHSEGTPRTLLDIHRYYRCHGSFKYLPTGDYWQKGLDAITDSLIREHEKSWNIIE